MLEEPWRIEMLGRLRAQRGNRDLSRFSTYKTGALLAYLAYYRSRSHGREELADLLWPEDTPEAARNSLRVALASLRRQLEPPGTPAGSVLIAGRHQVQLHPETTTTDVSEFETALQSATQAQGQDEQVRLLSKAVALYAGDLLPGYYEDWIPREHQRLAEAFIQAARSLTDILTQAGQWERAIDCARRAVTADPLREESHCDLMRLYAAMERPLEGLRQYRALERVLQEELGESPSPVARALAETLRQRARAVVPTQEAAPAAAPSAAGKSERHRPGLPLPRPATLPAETSSLQLTPRLPAPLSRYFGREPEIAQLVTWLSSACLDIGVASSLASTPRLFTLTGPGGCGKTRLALEVSRRFIDTFEGAVWFVPLADLTEVSLLPGAIADALRLPRSARSEPLEQVLQALAGRPALLALDNFEHLAETGASIVRTLLERAPALLCLVTSRQRLDLEGEQEFPVQPLPTPVRPGPPERLLEYASVQLFVDRAQKVRPEFRVTVRNAGSVAALCHYLEGIPLAIELAAAWVSTLTPTQMLERQSNRFGWLESRRKDVTERHRSLRAAIDWSYRLLTPELQRFFAQLSVFRGGCTLEAAGQVTGYREQGTGEGQEGVARQSRSHKAQESIFPGTCNLSPVTPPLFPMTSNQALDYLTQLQERSLVAAEEYDEEMRFRMLETLREYAAERLDTQERGVLQRGHLQYFLALAEEAAPNLSKPEQAMWLDRLGAEYDNLRAALAWALENDAAAGLRLGLALYPFWEVRSLFVEGCAWWERLLAKSDVAPPKLRAKALHCLATLLWSLGDYAQAHALFEESLTLKRNAGDIWDLAKTLNNLGLVVLDQGDYTAANALFEECLTLCRNIGNREGIANALGNQGNIANIRGDYAAARRFMEESLAIKREIGHQWGIALSLSNLGGVLCRQGDYTGARALFEESLAIRRELGDRHGIGSALNNLGIVALEQGDYETARPLFEESLATKKELGDKQGMANALTNLGIVAREEGDYAAARAFLAEGLAIRHAIGNVHGIVLSLYALGRLATAQGEAEQAARLFGAMEALCESIGIAVPSDEVDHYEQDLATLRTALGEEAFAAAWSEGRAMQPEHAVTHAFAVKEAPGRPKAS